MLEFRVQRKINRAIKRMEWLLYEDKLKRPGLSYLEKNEKIEKRITSKLTGDSGEAECRTALPNPAVTELEALIDTCKLM